MKAAYEKKMIVGATAPETGINIYPSREGLVIEIEHDGHRISLLLHPDEARSVGVGVLENGAAARAAMAQAAVQVVPGAALVGINGGKS